jgi:hypothetical protein
MKNILAIIGGVSIGGVSICFLLYLHSPWTPSNRNPPPKELQIVSVLAKSKEFADQVIQEYSTLPKDNTQEIRSLYKDAQSKFNTLVELFGYGADNRRIPLDTISEKIPEAEIAYKQLYNYIIPPKEKRSIDQKTTKTEWPNNYPPMTNYHLQLNEQGFSPVPESGELARAFNEIVGQKEIYEKIAKRIEKYRWAPFPEK